jgi:hypothetical protein
MDSRTTAHRARIRLAATLAGAALLSLGAFAGAAFAESPPHPGPQIDKFVPLPPPDPGGVIGDAIAAFVCLDGTVIEYNPGIVTDPESLCPVAVNPDLPIPDFDFGICIPPTHGDNPCDDDDWPGPGEPLDPTRDDCADPLSFESYGEFAEECVLVECLEGAFPADAVPAILCIDDGDLCTHLDDYDSFDAYFEACFGDSGDRPDEPPAEAPEARQDEEPGDGDDRPGEGGDEPGHDDGDQPDGDDGAGEPSGEPLDEPAVEEQVEVDVDAAEVVPSTETNGGQDAPLPPDTGSGVDVIAPVTSNGFSVAALALVAAGGAVAGGLLRRRG